MRLFVILNKNEIKELEDGKTLLTSKSTFDVPDYLSNYITSDIQSDTEDMGCIPVLYSIGKSKLDIKVGSSILPMLGFDVSNAVEIEYSGDILYAPKDKLLEEVLGDNDKIILHSKVKRRLRSMFKEYKKSNKLIYGFIPYLTKEMIVQSNIKQKSNNEINYFSMRG